MPPTERRGRVHTSTVTCAIIDPNVTVSDAFSRRDDADFRIEWFSGSGAGGQHRNRHCNSCRLIHVPTGIVETRQGRERASNLKSAKDAIIQTLNLARTDAGAVILSKERNGQIGSGMRGDKTVTIRFQDDQVTNHTNGKSMTATKYMKGFMDDVWS